MLLITNNNWKSFKLKEELIFLGHWCIKDEELKSIKKKISNCSPSLE